MAALWRSWRMAGPRSAVPRSTGASSTCCTSAASTASGPPRAPERRPIASRTAKPSPSKADPWKLYAKSKDGRASSSSYQPHPFGGGGIERYTRYDELIREAAGYYQLPEAFVRAIIKVESDYDQTAHSVAGAQGLMQLMPETAGHLLVTDAWDPRENVFGGCRYLRILANTFNGDLDLTIAAYNAGEGSVIRAGGIPDIAETQDYVVKVKAFYRRYRALDPVEASVGGSGEP